MSVCKSCGAPIEWVTSVTERAMPLDAVPPEDQRALWDPPPPPAPTDLRGKLVIVAGKARPATEADVLLGRRLRVSHFATCPQADRWRRER